MTTEKAAPTIHARRAKHEDASNIFRLLRSEAELAKLNFDPDHALHSIASMLREGEVYVADLSGRVVGVIGLEIDSNVVGYATSGTQTVRIMSILRGFGDSGVREFLLRHAVTLAQKGGYTLRIVVADTEVELAEAVAQQDIPVYGTIYQTVPSAIVDPESTLAE